VQKLVWLPLIVAVQQGWPGPPQPPQLPPLQVGPPVTFGQAEPLLVQVLVPLAPATQQAPLPHVVSAQQAWPGPPQAVHTAAPPLPVHTSLASQVRPAQQAWPGPPQAWQTPPTQAPPVMHAGLVAQQTLPRAPQAIGMSACDMSGLLVGLELQATAPYRITRNDKRRTSMASPPKHEAAPPTIAHHGERGRATTTGLAKPRKAPPPNLRWPAHLGTKVLNCSAPRPRSRR
jgi:hypothetical protein